MSIRYKIFQKRKLIVSTFPSLVERDTVIRFWAELSVDPGFDPRFNHLMNLTGVAVFRLFSEDLKAIAHMHPFASISRRAVVTYSDHVFGMHKIYEKYQEALGFNFRVFRFMNEATNWVVNNAEQNYHQNRKSI